MLMLWNNAGSQPWIESTFSHRFVFYVIFMPYIQSISYIRLVVYPTFDLCHVRTSYISKQLSHIRFLYQIKELNKLPAGGICCPRAADARERPRTYIEYANIEVRLYDIITITHSSLLHNGKNKTYDGINNQYYGITQDEVCIKYYITNTLLY